MHATLPLLNQFEFPPLRRRTLETLQVNLGYKCNQTCLHCHVNAGPTRTEMMGRNTVDEVLDFIRTMKIKQLDLTGGAPELNPYFRDIVVTARDLGVHVIDRCNLTILEEPGQDQLAEFLAQHSVEVVASLPCYLEDNVNRQRGNGVFAKSIRGLKLLNRLGYAMPGSSLTLTLVYNPQGPSLPPAQQELERDYRTHLAQYDVTFNRLIVITNMPIARFGSTLVSKGQFNRYMTLLKDNFRAENLDAVMCHNLLSVDWQGFVYDCDFNQMLDLPVRLPGISRTRLTDLLERSLEGNAIAVRDHCFGCTAGQGSSCRGALAE